MRFRAFSFATWSRASIGFSPRKLGIPERAGGDWCFMGGMQALQWAVSHPEFHALGRCDYADGTQRSLVGGRRRGPPRRR